jgi:hypothetical protein
MRYYYPPFKYTDTNERKTWDYYQAKGYVHFLSPNSPSEKPTMSPQELGAQLIGDGLPNKKINIRLLVCFGGGRHELHDDYAKWNTAKGLDGPIARRLALELKVAAPNVVVAGYLGPTQTGKGSTLVSPFSRNISEAGTHVVKVSGRGRSASRGPEEDKVSEPDVRVMNTALIYSTAEDVRALYDEKNSRKEYKTVTVAAPKLFIVWYDTNGNTAQKWPERPHDDKGTERPQNIDAAKPLSHLKDGDLLLIMSHGVATGWLVRSPGPDTEKGFAIPVLEVNVEQRAQGGKAAKLEDRKAPAGSRTAWERRKQYNQ